MEMADNNTPNQSLTSLQEGNIWRLLRVTLTGDTFKTPFNTSDVVFGGDLVGLSINGHVPPGTTFHGLGMNQVILDGVNGTITNNTGQGTITIKGAALQGGNDVTLNVIVTAAP